MWLILCLSILSSKTYFPEKMVLGAQLQPLKLIFRGWQCTCFLMINIINQIEHVISGPGDGSVGKVLAARAWVMARNVFFPSAGEKGTDMSRSQGLNSQVVQPKR